MMLILSTLIYLLMMLMIVTLDDFVLRMYGQIGAGGVYMFFAAMVFVARQHNLDEIVMRAVKEEMMEKKMLEQRDRERKAKKK